MVSLSAVCSDESSLLLLRLLEVFENHSKISNYAAFFTIQYHCVFKTVQEVKNLGIRALYFRLKNGNNT